MLTCVMCIKNSLNRSIYVTLHTKFKIKTNNLKKYFYIQYNYRSNSQRYSDLLTNFYTNFRSDPLVKVYIMYVRLLFENNKDTFMWANETDLLIYETFMTILFFLCASLCRWPDTRFFHFFFCVVCKFHFYLIFFVRW